MLKRFLQRVTLLLLVVATFLAVGTAASAAAPKASCIGAFGKCFVAGTPVLMADGSWLPIEKIREGDFVLSKSDATGLVGSKQVTNTRVRPADATLTVGLDSGVCVETTEEHPFWVEGIGWVPAGRLAVGNAISVRAGPEVANPTLRVQTTSRVSRLEHHAKAVTVYNFEVADNHS